MKLYNRKKDIQWYHINKKMEARQVLEATLGTAEYGERNGSGKGKKE